MLFKFGLVDWRIIRDIETFPLFFFETEVNTFWNELSTILKIS